MSVVKGADTTIAYGNGASVGESNSFTPFAAVTEITPFSVEADDIDTSHMTTAERWKTFEAGWADAGEVEFTIQFDSDETETVFGLFRQNKGFQLKFSDDSTWSFTGYVKAFGDQIDREEYVTTDITIKVSGKPEFDKAVAQ